MVMAKSTNPRYNILAEALNIIDPQGFLAAGTETHNAVTEMILSWMDEFEPNEVLRKSEIAGRMFRYKRHLWP